jgi:nuclear cap-binding protein subunit 1
MRFTEEAPVEDSPQLSTALRALSSLTREQRMALLAALQAFVGALSAHDIAGGSGIDVLAEQSWNKRAGWGDHEWARWETCAWYKHFCRLVRVFTIQLGNQN